MTDTVLRVDNPAHPRGGYDVVVGHDLGARLPEVLGSETARVAVIHPESLTEPASRVTDALAPYDVLDLPIPDGEAAKTAGTAAVCWDALGAAGFTRSDAVVAVGGGATTDLGGFVAATWLRGVPVVHVPTTVLGMVDAAVGGKTGINTAAGKNLVGSFHEPTAVLCDLTHLATLPRADFVAGLAEVAKCGFIADLAILDLIERSTPEQLSGDSPEIRELVERAIRVKVDVVTDDLRETGGSDGAIGREALNYGHTLGHAIEKAEDYHRRHGEAVALGCVYAARLAAEIGLLDSAAADRHAAVLGRLGLPTSYSDTEFAELRAAMSVDKKSRGSTLRFVLLSDLGRPQIVAGPPEEALARAYAALGGRAS
jgi:3-dehydroquinate synthase